MKRDNINKKKGTVGLYKEEKLLRQAVDTYNKETDRRNQEVYKKGV